MTRPLSIAAEEVLNAWFSSKNGSRQLGDLECLAAALSAAAYHVSSSEAAEELHAIADELEGRSGG